MTSREQFEAKCRNGLINGGLAKHENGKYASELTDAVWRGWQASREAVEVVLPQRQSLCASGYGNGYFVACNDGEGLEYDDVVEAIRAAGVNVIEREKNNG